jgi:osmotically-inducible protein OsmY
MQGLMRVLAGVVTLAALPVLAADVTLKERVEARLVAARLLDRGDLQVEVHDCRVVLTGATTTWDVRRRAEAAARKEAREVENRIQVVPEARSAEAFRKDLEHALWTPQVSAFDAVGATLEGGVVTLTGSVYRAFLKDEIEDQVGRVAGVTELRNRIEVQPVSFFDDRLRRELYRAVYGDGPLAQYANWPEPPVRILVDRGKVTLEGTLSSAVERTLVEHRARGTLNFGVENRIQLEGSKPEPKPEPATILAGLAT